MLADTPWQQLVATWRLQSLILPHRVPADIRGPRCTRNSRHWFWFPRMSKHQKGRRSLTVYSTISPRILYIVINTSWGERRMSRLSRIYWNMKIERVMWCSTCRRLNPAIKIKTMQIHSRRCGWVAKAHMAAKVKRRAPKVGRIHNRPHHVTKMLHFVTNDHIVYYSCTSSEINILLARICVFWPSKEICASSF